MASKPDQITLHIFANGRGFFDLGQDIRPAQVEEFRMWWEEEGKYAKTPNIFFGGVKVRVVEHPMPFGEVEVIE